MERIYLSIYSETIADLGAAAKRLSRTRVSLIRTALRTFAELLKQQGTLPIRVTFTDQDGKERELTIL